MEQVHRDGATKDPMGLIIPIGILLAGALALILSLLVIDCAEKNITTSTVSSIEPCNQLQPLPPDQQPSTTSHTSTCPSPYPSTWVVNLAPRRGISHYYTFETAQSRPRPTPQNDEKNTGGPGLQQISGRCWGDLATAINCIGYGGCRGARFEGLGRVEAWWVWGDLGVWGASGGDELQVREP